MELSSEKYDIVIIGGGCVGSGIALDATLREHGPPKTRYTLDFSRPKGPSS